MYVCMGRRCVHVCEVQGGGRLSSEYTWVQNTVHIFSFLPSKRTS